MPKRIRREIREALKRDIALLTRSPWLGEPLRFIIKKHGKTMRAMQRQADKSGGGRIRIVTATVIAVSKEFKHVRVEAPDDRPYAITDKTPGIDWKCLREGQRIECSVTTTDFPRVVEARILEPRNDNPV